MAQTGNRKVLAVLEDLLFTVKINDAAKRNGLQVQFVKSEADALSAAAEKPMLLILDLNVNSVDPISLIPKIKEFGRIPIIAFVSHVQGELKQRAHDAGADMVMARSAFSTNLPQILKRHAGSY
ncbi:MAG TPA: response regulator [Bryobacteraceae bacterium]|nr:response regulator [Bryobacteraceae bacterium]